jgi:LacI family transcriptional regulator
MEKLKRPVGCIGSRFKPEFGVSTRSDDKEAVIEMMNYLINLGHKRIGFVSGRPGTNTTLARIDGYRTALQNAGLPFYEQLIEPGDYLFQSGMIAAERMLSLNHPPTAIFASNDDMAAGAISAAHKFRLSVPGDLSIAGFDDSLMARSVWPALTTMRQPVAEMVARAVNELIKIIRDPGQIIDPGIILPCQLIVRDSTAPPSR